MQGNTGAGVWADAAYRSEEMEAKLKAAKLTSHIHRKGKRGKPLTEQGKASNRTKSTVRVRVEHVFGAQTNGMGGTLVRTIGMVRAKARIEMKNLACTMRRLVQRQRINPFPACPRLQKSGRTGRMRRIPLPIPPPTAHPGRSAAASCEFRTAEPARNNGKRQ